MRYRRSRVSGGTFFFTANLADRNYRLLTEHVGMLREVTRTVRQRHSFEIVAMVVLPDHLHAVWTLPPGDRNYPMRWSLIKAGFSRVIMKTEPVSESHVCKRERGVWQRRYWEHQIRNEDDLARHVDYIHFNPVKHGHVKSPVEWPYSSIHRYIRKGFVSFDWGMDIAADESGFGERE